jgi:hypothetical protein
MNIRKCQRNTRKPPIWDELIPIKVWRLLVDNWRNDPEVTCLYLKRHIIGERKEPPIIATKPTPMLISISAPQTNPGLRPSALFDSIMREKKFPMGNQNINTDVVRRETQEFNRSVPNPPYRRPVIQCLRPEVLHQVTRLIMMAPVAMLANLIHENREIRSNQILFQKNYASSCMPKI